MVNTFRKCAPEAVVKGESCLPFLFCSCPPDWNDASYHTFVRIAVTLGKCLFVFLSVLQISGCAWTRTRLTINAPHRQEVAAASYEVSLAFSSLLDQWLIQRGGKLSLAERQRNIEMLLPQYQQELSKVTSLTLVTDKYPTASQVKKILDQYRGLNSHPDLFLQWLAESVGAGKFQERREMWLAMLLLGGVENSR